MESQLHWQGERGVTVMTWLVIQIRQRKSATVKLANSYAFLTTGLPTKARASPFVDFRSKPIEVGSLSTPPHFDPPRSYFDRTTNDLLSCFPSQPSTATNRSRRPMERKDETTSTTGKKHLNPELLHVPNLIHFDCVCRIAPGNTYDFHIHFRGFPFRRESFAYEPLYPRGTGHVLRVWDVEAKKGPTEEKKSIFYRRNAYRCDWEMRAGVFENVGKGRRVQIFT